ncbi:MAG: hypothetical protein HGB18_04860 [Candidatus Moranbacteria bacterium]|nr:hypothetical protein [Candidatus Moranbacteria bacterium]
MPQQEQTSITPRNVYPIFLDCLCIQNLVNFDRSNLPEKDTNPPKARIVFNFGDIDDLMRIEYCRISGEKVGMDIHLPKPSFTRSETLQAAIRVIVTEMFSSLQSALIQVSFQQNGVVCVSVKSDDAMAYRGSLEAISEKIRELAKTWDVLRENEETYSSEADLRFGRLVQTLKSQIEGRLETKKVIASMKRT